MDGRKKTAWHLIWIVLAASTGALVSSSGCQVDVGGQTLPSPYYMRDDVQYFAPGPEFKLAREAAALQQAKAQQQAQQAPMR